ncbi:gamma-glutamyl phosphate reductase [Bombiscardovia apis]|uniref:Gamma-glutamyl phosphate reductase n=1 Tax=Bombiscardovia apis TaxID=2932182 RepID=A0ABN6SIJ4_9BIFI|nr:glutamate-5-semialdehyde dehydrogenase [Bombiscardovia apis]BDR54741.1 gamma-glutamyl phosphate reductase [Bombiscardovia apis]
MKAQDSGRTSADEFDSRVFADVCEQADKAAQAQRDLALATSETRRELLHALADALNEGADSIIAANEQDEQEAFAAGMSSGLLDRLHYDRERIANSAQALKQVAQQPDPLGQVVSGHRMGNGMRLNQIRVPLGVVAMIYEARPNVTVDVAGLGLKSGNAVLLRGGHAAERTNQATVALLQSSLEQQGFSPDLISSVDQYGRAGARALMEARGHIDLLVPRGGKGLISSVVEHSKVPTIETGAGNVHIYVDSSADMRKAVSIVLNAKTQRVGVCNAAEKLLIHRDIAAQFVPMVAQALTAAQVELRLDTISYDLIAGLQKQQESALPLELVRKAQPEDWDEEYLALTMGLKIVDSIDQAIDHINNHSTGHTEAILAQDYNAIERFSSRVDSAVVMVNASTRFTDGEMFGMGAELGISTQKLHARGPMGLNELTTTKWIGYGTGQVRQ